MYNNNNNNNNNNNSNNNNIIIIIISLKNTKKLILYETGATLSLFLKVNIMTCPLINDCGIFSITGYF